MKAANRSGFFIAFLLLLSEVHAVENPEDIALRDSIVDANRWEPSPCIVTAQDRIWSGVVIDPPDLSNTSFAKDNSSLVRLRKGKENDWTHVVMVNPSYAAALKRDSPNAKWTIGVFGEAGSKEYEQMQVANTRSAKGFYYAGGKWLVDVLRNSQVLSKKDTSFFEQEAIEWELMTKDEKKVSVVTSAEVPYVILGNRISYGSVLSELVLSGWNDTSSHLCPNTYKIFNTENSQQKVIAHRSYEYSSLSNWDAASTYLAYYGLPEPGLRSGRWGVLLVLTIVGSTLLVIGFAVKNSRK